MLEYQPGVYQRFLPIAYGAATQSPDPVQGWLLLVDRALAHDPIAANAALAAVELLVGVALVVGRWTRPVLLGCVPLFLAIWAFGQGLGLPFTPGITDLNSGPVYVLLAVALWRARCWERWSLDAWVAAGAGRRPRAIVAATATAGGLLVTAGLSAGSALAQAQLAGSPAPAARAGAVLALDPATQGVVLFGGCGPLVCDRDTWTWSVHGWRRLDPAAAPPALGYAALSAAPGGGLVLFGGSGNLGAGPTYRATWAFDHGRWRLLERGGPAPRRFPAMAADPAAGAIVLFGGDDGHGHVIPGTWLSRGRSWHPVPGPQPPARTAAAMAFDPGLHGIVLFGGNDGERPLDDTWLFARGGWVRLHPRRSPPARAYVGMATDPALRTVVLLTGRGGLAATWTLAAGTSPRRVSWVAHPGPSPPAATFAALATAPGGDGVVCFGGLGDAGNAFGAGSAGYGRRLWRWRGGRWTVPTAPPGPPHRG